MSFYRLENLSQRFNESLVATETNQTVEKQLVSLEEKVCFFKDFFFRIICNYMNVLKPLNSFLMVCSLLFYCRWIPWSICCKRWRPWIARGLQFYNIQTSWKSAYYVGKIGFIKCAFHSTQSVITLLVYWYYSMTSTNVYACQYNFIQLCKYVIGQTCYWIDAFRISIIICLRYLAHQMSWKVERNNRSYFCFSLTP